MTKAPAQARRRGIARLEGTLQQTSLSDQSDSTKLTITGLNPTRSFRYKLTVLAEDTTDVYLNDPHLLAPEGWGPYNKCISAGVNCVTKYTFDFNVYGPNTVLDFDVHQAAGYSTGLNLYDQTVTPEPGALMLLGTGLLTGAGALLRRVRRA